MIVALIDFELFRNIITMRMIVATVVIILKEVANGGDLSGGTQHFSKQSRKMSKALLLGLAGLIESLFRLLLIQSGNRSLFI